MENSLDSHFGQVIGHQDGLVSGCIVLMEMPLSRLEELWSFASKSLPEFPQNFNVILFLDSLTMGHPMRVDQTITNKKFFDFSNQIRPPHISFSVRSFVIRNLVSAFLKSSVPAVDRCLAHERRPKGGLHHFISLCSAFIEFDTKFCRGESLSKLSSRPDCIVN